MKKNFSAKHWKFMSVCAVQLLISITLCGVALSHPSYAQLLDKEITINIVDVPFEKALKEIERAAQVRFAYSIDQLEGEPDVSLSLQGRTLRYALEELLTARNIRYNVHEKDAVITLKKIMPKNAEEQSSVDVNIKVDGLESPMIWITGIVTESSRSTPMAGVNVLVKGTTNGTATDANGHYTVGAEVNDVLVFSFIGYTSVEVPVSSRTVIDVAMTSDALNLGEVVVNAGYWEVKEREQTGNISRLTAQAIEKQPVSNPLQTLQGRMTGVYIQQNTGVPGGGFTIQVRGQNSLRTGTSGGVNGNLPLYLVDGVPFTSASLTSPAISNGNLAGGNPLSVLNPNDIESIEVLKDADATAIYGSRGANGVVLITTKRAKSGKEKIEFDIYHGISQVSTFIDLLKTPEYLEMRGEAFANDGATPTTYNAPDLLAWNAADQTDWQRELIGGKAHTSNAQLTLSGGSERTQFLFGGSYYRETTVFPSDDAFRRYSGRLTINHTSDDGKLNVSATTNYGSSANNIPSIDFTGQAVTLAPNAPPVFDENGLLNWAGNTWSNPFALLRRKYRGTIDNLVSNASLGYRFFKGFNLKSSFGYTTMKVDEISTNPVSAYNPVDTWRAASATFGTGSVKTWIVEPQAEYSRTIGQLTLTTLIGTTLQESVQVQQTIQASGYTSDAFLENMKAAPKIVVSDNGHSAYRYGALFGRVNFNWGGRYILNATARRDGSSRFGPGNKFANFGAIGAAWLFSNEQFAVDHLPFVSFGKIRISYGATGSDAIGNYQFMETFSPIPYPYGKTMGLALTRLANPEYSWETNRKFETGLDFSLFSDRFSIGVSFYRNHATDQLVGLPLPLMTGQSSVQYNLPATVENSGWEFLLTSINLKRQVFQWTSTVNLTIPSNKLVRFPGLETFPAYANRFDVGKSTYTYKGFQYNDVDPSTGYYAFVDVNGDGAISSSDDLIGLKEVTQKFYGGFGNSLRFGGFGIDFHFQFVKQTGYNYARSFSMPGTFSNQPALVLARWQAPGDPATIQRFTATDPTGKGALANYYYLSSDRMITDASFVRLKNVSISWVLPDKWMKRFKGSRAYLQGQNLWTGTSYTGLDPETQNSQSLPPLTTLTIGVHISL